MWKGEGRISEFTKETKEMVLRREVRQWLAQGGSRETEAVAFAGEAEKVEGLGRQEKTEFRVQSPAQ